MTTPDQTVLPAAEERLLRERLQRAGYLADEDLATTVWLASALQRPLLLEGDAGVGKTALATALAHSLLMLSVTEAIAYLPQVSVAN